LRQQIAQLVILVADRDCGQSPDQGLVDAGELDALIDELLALIDLGLDRTVLLADDEVDDDQD
jgi:hypothetical protein